MNYRRKLVSRIITHIDSGCDVTVSGLAKSLTLLDATHVLKSAWEDVKQSSIINCFAKAGFLRSCPDQLDLDKPPDRISAEEFHALVDIDASLECHGILTDEDICASVCQDTADPQPDSEDEINKDPSPALKSRDVILALCTLRAFMEQHTADFSTFYKLENQMQKLITSKAMQHSIRDFLFQAYAENSTLEGIAMKAATILPALLLQKTFKIKNERRCETPGTAPRLLERCKSGQLIG